jgi:hypothetical protein
MDNPMPGQRLKPIEPAADELKQLVDALIPAWRVLDPIQAVEQSPPSRPDSLTFPRPLDPDGRSQVEDIDDPSSPVGGWDHSLGCRGTAMASISRREERKLKRVAYHEAGHAVVALSLRRRFRYVTIVPKDNSLGHVLKTAKPESIEPDCDASPRVDRWIEREVMVIMAGSLAEEVFTGLHNPIGASSDYEAVINCATQVEPDPIVCEKYLGYLWAKMEAHVRQPETWVQIEALAKALLNGRRLGIGEVREICRAAQEDQKRINELNDEVLKAYFSQTAEG